ncbi:MAG: N-acetyl-gamma-glutamyl-phosphate reductase [Oscillospiraceae bacterium]|nr:N-acetyl-gamma-glutamyl-phosphate reductase [Oscillospiraceae bacterium]
MKTKVFIDGESGTTGLKIFERLEMRNDIELLKIASHLRKDSSEKRKLLNAADFVFLCLPDDAAVESVSLIDNPDVRVIDASTAHRTNPDWDYGFPELFAKGKQYERIRQSKRVAVPGCYASGFIALVFPLIEAGIISRDDSLFCYGISGYSGAGKPAIAEYESPDRSSELGSARMYALSQSHKHQPEMQKVCGLTKTPMFSPIIDDYYSGMIVSVPLQAGHESAAIKDVYRSHYCGENSRVRLCEGENVTFLAANSLADSDDMEIYVFGDGERVLLSARYDNLGKGASGAAVQCFNLMK